MKLIVATGNSHKLSEIQNILSIDELVLIGLDCLQDPPIIIEDGLTFEANAIKKAVTIARFSRQWTMADDSGIEVDALDGEPGVRSARYAGEPCDDLANNTKLLRCMTGITNRRARFRCVIAISSPLGMSDTVTGTCEGTLLEAPRGTTGFGYDPLFLPDGSERSFAELPADEKNRISHRAQALAAARKQWWPGGHFTFRET